ncbi:Opacity protein [Bacteroides luti]|uniref:Opacity protein n=1 Tax=Bacteroides luti TaxID=1297750 RepID=A0A1M5EA73_9BACE|nr:porin [Bacteroides luti]SHF76139.1 Opacity protein [Bacteroides luti]
MKKYILFLGVLLCMAGVRAQQDGDMRSSKSLFEEVTNIKKKTDRFNFFLNMNGSFDNQFIEDTHQMSKFNMRQLRIEAKGKINDWLSYRWRQRLNRPNTGSGNIDNLPTSIDVAGIGVKLTDKFSMFIGKQCAAYGGVEFDLNPIEIYEYSDMIENMSNFLTGVNFAYNFNDNHQLQFQVLNSLNNSFANTYDVGTTGTVQSQAPLVYTLNWNGSFFDNAFKTRWSASLMNEAKGKNMYYYALGNELTQGKFNMFFDFMYSNEELDRNGIMSKITNSSRYGNAVNAQYLSLVTKLNYRFAPKWNVFLEGMYETASLKKDLRYQMGPVEFAKGKYRTSYGYFAGLEYYPMESNLHFFLTYVGRAYEYTNRARSLMTTGFDDNTNRLSLGFIYQLQMF